MPEKTAMFQKTPLSQKSFDAAAGLPIGFPPLRFVPGLSGKSDA
jgi:hypothetical protein